MQSPSEKEGLKARHIGPVGYLGRLVSDSLTLQWQLAVLPWRTLVFVVWCCNQLTVRFLTTAGSPPVSYRDKFKLKEALKVIEHLQQREDGFRQKLKEINSRLDVKSKELRRCEAKLSKAQKVSGSTLQPGVDHQTSKKKALVDGPIRLSTHINFFVVGILPVYWLLHQPAVPAVSRKFAWSLVLPEGLIYFFTIFGSGPGSANFIIQSCSLFLAGFVFTHWLHSHC